MPAAVEIVGANVPSGDVNGPQISNGVDHTERYAQERAKRVGKGSKQYLDPKQSPKLSYLLEDPWIASGTPIQQVVSDGGHRKFVIVGAGFGGILFAVNLIKAGFKADNILIVDPAGGFGGTWYWNRYPGLMCDVEAYIYMPLLEEMDYMPKHKYASGDELREYAERICEKYGLTKTAMFQSSVKRMHWDAGRRTWKLQLEQKPKGGSACLIDMTADFVYLANGILANAKVPDLPGTDEFRGSMFHTARWNYEITGGSSAVPDMTKLQDKRVGIIGTGATAVQAVPQLARWSKHLYVFQRTPSSVAVRDNRKTDPAVWTSEIASKPGWQRDRSMNFFKFVTNADQKPEKDLVNDGWTRLPTFSALIGGPSYNVTMENVDSHVAKMHALDIEHMDRVRSRAASTVKDQSTASSLQPWYNTWCKRPCFHDDYLPAFNRSNVTLVDTNGEGVDRITSKGVLYKGNEYELDVLVVATGYASPGIGSPPQRAGIECIGSEGETLDQRYERGVSTLHGVTTRGFPNMFWPGPLQSSASPNFMFTLETLSEHVAHIISEATKRVGGTPVIQPTSEGEEDWTMKCLAGAATFASMSGCTPGYLNNEGEIDQLSKEQQYLAARKSSWAKGIEDYVRVLEEWQADGKLEGLEILPKA
ncbi:hypothetical protein AC578_1005 [Pseudocercospora eumusae]|uniref:FAD/NAD(P)-binding domain-containing protein n=1 Tax=Pseudocercospora eumusae TaxID=321146 RepID=A0A139HTK1_9PEZI|nr:hypothetical protein AC578_1005 [Pseudocercospora eumusae]